MRRALLSVDAVAVPGAGNVAHAKNDGANCSTKALDLAKMLGYPHGLAPASMMILQKTGDKALAQSFEDAAMAKQAEHDREAVNYMAVGCK